MDKDTRVQDTLEKLVRQLYMYRQVDNETTNPMAMAKSTISGVVDKYGKKNSSAKDDLAFCFTFNMGVCDGIYDRRYEYLDYSKFRDWY
jgi:hypothetical protein